MDLRSACPEIAMPVFRKEKPCFFAVGHVPHRAQNKSQCAAQQRDQAVVRRVGRVEKCITVRCQSLLVQESNPMRMDRTALMIWMPPKRVVKDFFIKK